MVERNNLESTILAIGHEIFHLAINSIALLSGTRSTCVPYSIMKLFGGTSIQFDRGPWIPGGGKSSASSRCLDISAPHLHPWRHRLRDRNSLAPFGKNSTIQCLITPDVQSPSCAHSPLLKISTMHNKDGRRHSYDRTA